MWRPSSVPLFAVAASLVLGAVPAHAASPKLHYALHCMGCHLADGRGTEGKVPPLAGSVGSFLQVPGGRAFLVQVPGTAQAPLSDAEIAALLNWLLPEFSRAQLPGDFAPFTAEEVASYRGTPLTDVARVRRELMAAIEAASPVR